MEMDFWDHINEMELSYPKFGYLKWCADLIFLEKYLESFGCYIGKEPIRKLLEDEYNNPTEFAKYKVSKKEKGIWCFEINR